MRISSIAPVHSPAVLPCDQPPPASNGPPASHGATVRVVVATREPSTDRLMVFVTALKLPVSRCQAPRSAAVRVTGDAAWSAAAVPLSAWVMRNPQCGLGEATYPRLNAAAELPAWLIAYSLPPGRLVPSSRTQAEAVKDWSVCR